MKSRAKLVLFAAAISAAVLLGSAGTARAEFLNIIDPVNPTFTQALGINGSNTIVGYGNTTIFNGFVLTLPPVPGNFTRQNVPGATGGTQVTGISGTGTTVGFSISPAGVTNGFAQTGGTFTTVDAPGTAFNQLLGINNAGTTAAGYSSTDPAGIVAQVAITVSGGPSFTSPVFTNINALLPANMNSQATGVNNAGTVVGFYQYAAGDFSAFLDKSGLISSFQFPGSISTQALGINNLGEIVGDYLSPGGEMFGFLDNGGTFTTLDPFGSTAVTANGINDGGEIVGFYTNAAGNTIGFLTPVSVPEPISGALFAAGLVGLGLICRRRKAA